MTKAKRTKTKYPNIFSYSTKKGIKYHVRMRYTVSYGVYKEIDRSGFSLPAARAFVRETEKNIEQHEFGYLNNHKITVDDYFETFKKNRIESKVWTSDSQVSFINIYNNHIFPDFGHVPLIKLNRNIYQKFINRKLYIDGYAYQSVKTFHNQFMALINDAVNSGVLERNRLSRIVLQRDSPDKNKKIELKDFKIFLETAEAILSKYQFARLYLTIFGLRRGEVNGITSRYVKFVGDQNIAELHVAITRTSNAPRKGPKTKDSDRIIRIDKKGSDLLEYAIQEATNIKKDFGEILHQDDYIFLNPLTGKPYSANHLNRLFEIVSDKANIKIHPHMMRHNFATQAALAGATLTDTANYLGHSNTGQTEHYIQRTNEGTNNVINLVETRLSEG
ncbi:tyrosine-type recombinase/integrase [Carnobacterium maltaromaticum]|uniref:tyrosine-type recombinase/integrase n=1 Tax=Carnobacterium maltaromaticum TaxID=2751 RepID=UPI0005516E2C|nr:site-specific integrase [Carnobacterium maltaromaticum]